MKRSTKEKQELDSAQAQPDDDVVVKSERETLKAAQDVEKCATIVFLSALVDLTIDGIEFVDWETQEGIVTGLRMLWKVSFAYRMWQVAKILKGLATDRIQGTSRDQSPKILQCLKTIDRAWKSSAVMITILATSNAALAWQHKLPHAKEALVLLILGVITVEFYRSSNETQDIVAKGATTVTVSTIQKQAVITDRSTSLFGAALYLQAFLIPFMALSHWSLSRDWQNAILTLLGITAPITMATLLRNVRQDKVKVLTDASKGGKFDYFNVSSASQLDFALSQQEFYQNITSSFKSEVLLKVVFVLLPLEELCKNVLSMFEDKL